MATKRNTVGSVNKSKEEGGSPYIKFSKDVSFKVGDTISLQSKKSQLQGLDSAVAAGKMSEATAEKIREKVNRLPEFVLFELVQLLKD